MMGLPRGGRSDRRTALPGSAGGSPAGSRGGAARAPREKLGRSLVVALLLAALLAVLVIAAGCGSDLSATAQPTPAVAVAATPAATELPPSATATAIPSPTATLQPSYTPAPSSSLGDRSTEAPAAAWTRTPAAASGTATATAARQPTPSPTIAVPNFSGGNALRYVQGLAVDIGSRPSNSPASERAAQYILDQFSALGYPARLQPYGFSHFQERSSELLLKQPELVELSSKGFVYTGSGAVEGPLVYCGLGRPTDFPNTKLRGQIALIERGVGLTFEEKVANAVAREVAGVILFNDRGGEFRGSLARQAKVPVVGILQHDGRRLQEYLRKGPAVVSLKVEAVTEARKGGNVVAVLRGASSTKRVVVGAHYDSVSSGPGANDNASGVGTLLEVASSLRGKRYPFDVVFVAFGDEEIGLVGSRKYLESLSPQEKGQIVAMVNLDMVGAGDQMEIGGDRELADRGLEAARHLGYQAKEMTHRLGTSSDHASFLDARIPAVFIHRVEDPSYHTRLDTADRIVPEKLQSAGRVALYLLEDLARRN